MPGEAGQDAVDERHHPLTTARPVLEVNGRRWARRDDMTHDIDPGGLIEARPDDDDVDVMFG